VNNDIIQLLCAFFVETPANTPPLTPLKQNDGCVYDHKKQTAGYIQKDFMNTVPRVGS
jgi:hypothetical protein